MTFQLYRCTECGKVSTSIGYLHGHAEKHRGYFGFLQIPFTKTSPANVDELMKLTEVIEVTDYDRITNPSFDDVSNGGELDTSVIGQSINTPR